GEGIDRRVVLVLVMSRVPELRYQGYVRRGWRSGPPRFARSRKARQQLGPRYRASESPPRSSSVDPPGNETMMKYNKGAILRSIEQPLIRDDIPEFYTGDTIRVDYKVVEGTRSRVQAFEGVVIARKNGKGSRSTVIVRKVSFGEGVERVFPVNSPLISAITV